jgi:serine/threonine protein kinase
MMLRRGTRVSADAPLIGAVVDGKYKIESLLGRGGMGAVYRAVHTGTDRTVALKVIAGSFAGDQEYVERFRREARACGRLRHPGIVDVTDFGVASHEGRPLPYLVMEFLDGRTLADALREQPTPPLPWVIEVLDQVCGAVEEAHCHGILHRDLKPENVWLEPDRRGGVFVKVLDFGLAKLDSGEEEARVVAALPAPRALLPVADDISATFASGTIAPTLSGVEAQTMASVGGSPMTTGIAGTPAYMSPEQSRGEPATARSDVYSIGVIAYRMITGQLPFEGSLDEVLTAKREQEPAPLRSIRPDVHADAANLVSLAMATDPARRPASAGVFGNMLAAQLEPAGAFFTRALVLCVSKLFTFLKVAALASAPLLAVAVLGSAWQLVAMTGGVTALSSRAALTFLSVLFVLSLVTQVMLGVLPLFVLHALHAPSRPIEVLTLVRAYGPRMRFWLSALLPVVIVTVSVLAMAGVSILLIRYFAPVLRTWPRPLRLVPLLIGVALPFVLGYKALQRKGLGIRETGMLGAVLLVEDLPFAAAVKRSTELVMESGGLRSAVQKWYNVVVVTASLLIGVTMGFSGAAGRAAGTFVLISPLLAAALILFLLANGVVASLMYLSARRSKGESLERIYSDLVTTKGATS